MIIQHKLRDKVGYFPWGEIILRTNILASGPVGIMSARKSQLKRHNEFLQSKVGGKVLLASHIPRADVRHLLLTPEKANYLIKFLGRARKQA